ncbi:hypothetical protein ARMGADRAFT_1036296 [Armillaria gallica]|uniref:Uncharacterized protein n=1 Tax=Armillaria gallica TaxID=47427 RepID=A0A2H3CR91_ARMGA|nr:hypothetical protein ARMGADRAFT_1036296 [Armillaria gallica]
MFIPYGRVEEEVHARNRRKLAAGGHQLRDLGPKKPSGRKRGCYSSTPFASADRKLRVAYCKRLAAVAPQNKLDPRPASALGYWKRWGGSAETLLGWLGLVTSKHASALAALSSCFVRHNSIRIHRAIPPLKCSVTFAPGITTSQLELSSGEPSCGGF